MRSRRNFKRPVAFLAPKEGPVGWPDALCVPVRSTSKDVAKPLIEATASTFQLLAQNRDARPHVPGDAGMLA